MRSFALTAMPEKRASPRPVRRRKRDAEEVDVAELLRSMEAAARAKNWREAARLAAEVADDAKLVEYSLLAAFGRFPEGERIRTALQAGELLAARGHYEEALPLLERARQGPQSRRAIA